MCIKITAPILAAGALIDAPPPAPPIPTPASARFRTPPSAPSAACSAAILLGDLVGGRSDRTEKIVGAGIGAIAGGAVGDYMDRQEAELRRQTAGTGVDVIRQGDDLILRMPSGITFPVDSYAIQPQFQTHARRRRADAGDL